MHYDVQSKDGDGPWTDWQTATTATSATFTGVNGHTYYFRCRACDNVSNYEAYPDVADTQTTVTLGILPAPAWVYDGLLPDTDWLNTTGYFAANWAAVPDAAGYKMAIGTTPGGTDTVNWTDIGPKTFGQLAYTFAEGGKYYASVRAYDVNGVDGGIATSDGATMDFTPPDSRVLDLAPTQSTLQFVVSWTGTDALSGVRFYQVQSRDGDGPWELWKDEATLTSATFTGVDGHTYYFRCRALDNAGNQEAYPDVADTQTTVSVEDTQPPISQVNPLAAVQTALEFTVSWSGTDVPSGIMHYDVQSKDGDGPWTDWQTATTSTSATFTGVNGHTYYFRCRALDNAGNQEAYPDIADTYTVINIAAVSLTVVPSPAALVFSAGEESKDVTYTITATGPVGVNLDRVRIVRNFTDGTSDETPEIITQRLTPGVATDIGRTIQVDDATRTRVLAGGTTGTFNLTAIFEGRDDNANNVSGSAKVTIEVRSAAPEAFTITNLRLEIPGKLNIDQSAQAKVTIEASRAGDITGRLSIDDKPWQDFGIHLEAKGDNYFDSPKLPTEKAEVGKHTLKVEIFTPTSLDKTAEYEVITTPEFKLTELILIKDVAKLTDFNFPTTPTPSPAGTNKYTLNGTAKFTLLSLDNQELAEAKVQNLEIEYNGADPKNSTIKSGSVKKELEVFAGPGAPEYLFKKYADVLRATEVRYEYPEGANTAPEYIYLDANIFFPKVESLLEFEKQLCSLDNILVGPGGIEGKAWSTKQETTLFGVTFALRDVGSSKAIVIGKTTKDGKTLFWVSLSGDIRLKRSGGTKETITAFEDFKIYHNGDIEGTFSCPDPGFRLIPGCDYLYLTKLQFTTESGKNYLKVDGKIQSLPSPIDKLITTTTFSFKFDIHGDIVGEICPINELAAGDPGHHLNTNRETETKDPKDPSEWMIPWVKAIIDLTYVGVKLTFVGGELKDEQSCIQIATDLYLPFTDDAGNPKLEDECRVQIGDVVNDKFQPGIEIDFAGHINWMVPPSIPIIDTLHPKLDLGLVKLQLFTLAIETKPSFTFRFNCSVKVNISGVSGGVTFENLGINLAGGLVTDGMSFKDCDLAIFDIVKVAVGGIEWSQTPTTIEYKEDKTTGEGTNRDFKKEDAKLAVSSYFRLTDAKISIGKEGGTLSGGVDEFLIFVRQSDNTKELILKNANLSVSGLKISADFDYGSDLRVAGTLKTPGDLELFVVGKIGQTPAGDPSFGLFGAVGGLKIVIVAGVFLTDVGGGFFYNPSTVDLDTVREKCEFERPDMNDKIEAKRPGGGENPGAFALLVYAGVTVAEKELVSGRALLTLTENYFNLDAEVKVIPKVEVATGTFYLGVHWSPQFYAEGSIDIDVDVVKIIKGNGHLDFYVYGEDNWGVLGNAKLKALQYIDVESSLFVGPPGFLVDAKFGYSLDTRVLKAHIWFNGMVWYKHGGTWGGYAKIDGAGEILKLANASFGLEGVLIHTSPDFIIYCVGAVKVVVLGTSIFDGSIWLSVSEAGFDSGTGRDARYDSLIEEAKNMAKEMEEEKDKATDAMGEATQALNQLTNEQQQKAGMGLVDAYGGFPLWVVARRYFDEMRQWGFDEDTKEYQLPEPMRWVDNNILFDDSARHLRDTRDNLSKAQDAIQGLPSYIAVRQQQVSQKIDEYHAVLEGELPTIEELGVLGNPCSKTTATITTPDGKVRIVTSFSVDDAKDSQNQQKMTNTKQDYAQYQQQLLQLVGQMDSKLKQLDELLYEGTTNVSGLTDSYSSGFNDVNMYYMSLIVFLADNNIMAANKLNSMNAYRRGTQTLEEAVRDQLQKSANFLSPDTLKDWAQVRIDILNDFLKMAGEPTYTPPKPLEQCTLEERRNEWIERGMDLWYRLPHKGLEGVVNAFTSRRDETNNTYTTSTKNFLSKWANYTGVLDRIYDRKSRLYEVLYDLYDQLSICDGRIVVEPASLPAGMQLRFQQNIESWQSLSAPATDGGVGISLGAVSGAVGGVTAVAAMPVSVGGVTAVQFGAGLEAAPAVAIGPIAPGELPTRRRYFQMKRDEIGTLLEVPHIMQFTGSCGSNTPYYARLNISWEATHPVKIADYSWRLETPPPPTLVAHPQPPVTTNGGTPITGLGFYTPGFILLPDWHSLGTRTGFFMPIMDGTLNPPGEYKFYLRARGAGGYAIARQGRINVGYSDANHPVVTSSLNTSDATPPTTPVVQVQAPYTASTTQLYAKWQASDPESGVEEYQYRILRLITTSPDGAGIGGLTFDIGIEVEAAPLVAMAIPEEILPWTSAGGMTELNIRELTLQDGSTYQIEVKAKNGVGMWSEAGSSIAIKVDTTPPTTPANASLVFQRLVGGGRMGAVLDLGFLGLSSTPWGRDLISLLTQILEEPPFLLLATWQPSTDQTSGISHYKYAIGTTEGGTDVVNWMDAITTFVCLSGLPWQKGATYYLTVKAIDNVGLESESATATKLIDIPDTTPPIAPVVSVQVSEQTAQDGGITVTPIELAVMTPVEAISLLARYRIKVTWTAAGDPESGIAEYQYAVGNAPGQTDIIQWTSVKKLHEFGFDNTVLPQGNLPYLSAQDQAISYYISVKAINYAGLETVGQKRLDWTIKGVEAKPVEKPLEKPVKTR